MRKVSCALACSEVDRAILKALCPQARIAVVPNGVDTDHYSPDPPESREEPWTVLFQGGMDWYPNQDAVAFFVFRIFSHVGRFAPQAVFRIAGRGPSKLFRRRFNGAPEMEFTETVPDVRDKIAKAWVCVVPLRSGSGTRLKILEAAAMGKAIVSTPLGAEGLEFQDTKEIIIADKPDIFAEATAKLLKKKSDHANLGVAARRCVELRYSLPVLRSALQNALALPERVNVSPVAVEMNRGRVASGECAGRGLG